MSNENEVTFFERHKTKIKVTLGITTGVVIGFVLASNRSTILGGIQSISMIHVGDNTVTTNLVRRGHPGIMVRNLETGEITASIRRMSEVLGVSTQKVYNMIKEGSIEVLGEAI